MQKQRVTVVYGDGIGPEITKAVIRILEAANAPLEYDVVQLGAPAYSAGITSGIPAESWETIRRNRVILKGPLTTPLGSGYKSVNVTLRKMLGLFANVRQCKAYTPFVPATHPGINMVIIRENEEDLYAGIEHQQTPEVTQVLKLITRPGTESIIRYAFEYARAYGRRKVTCMTKNNIMKITDGLFARTFAEIAQEYPDIKSDHQIIDIGAARVAAQPQSFDVIVTLNLYGDILSDIAAQVAGSVGLAGSANIGRDAAMFEAIHGSAPDIAGKGIANPSGMLVAAVQMLVHLGLPDVAQTIKNAWLCTLEDGIHTPDIWRAGLGQREVGTDAFTDAVIARLGRVPETLEPVHYQGKGVHIPAPAPLPRPAKALQGVDVFLDWDTDGRNPDVLGEALEALSEEILPLKMITNRGVKVYPGGMPETFKTDHWRCRFMSRASSTTFDAVLRLLGKLHEAGYEVIKTEHLYTFDGQPGFSLGQGE
ncbi:MAG: NADP-dependent isocitrate dehydrogenase [Anaerolineales bacterium]